MRTTHRTCAAIAACAALLVLTGCGDDTKPPAPDFTPTVHIETPSPSASDTVPTEPPLPDAAKEPTEEGARAFTAYYWDLINYAQVTGDVKGLVRASGPHCEGCNGGIWSVSDVYKNGGHVTAGNYAEVIKKIVPYVPKPDVVAFEMRVDVANDAHEAIDGDGVSTPFQADSTTYKIYVLWTDRGWRLDVMEIK